MKDTTASQLRPAGQFARDTRPEVDGKFLRCDGERFYVRGVTYGTFAATELGLFPGKERVEEDFAAMVAVGINTVRTYTVPEGAVLDLAEKLGLKLLVGVWWDDPRYLERPTAEAWKEMATEARAAVGRAAGTCGEHPAVLGFVVGNEIPGPIVRWHGQRRVEGLLRSLYEAGKEAAPNALFSYANYPTTEYLDTSCFDFDCFNVFLEDELAYRRYLAQLQIDTADRPLILTELGLDSASHGERRQAEVLEWQLRGAMEYGRHGIRVSRNLRLFLDRRVVGRRAQGRGLEFRPHPGEQTAKGGARGRSWALQRWAAGIQDPLAEGVRGGLRLPGGADHR
jgi:O-antigen biosynthesis protein